MLADDFASAISAQAALRRSTAPPTRGGLREFLDMFESIDVLEADATTSWE